MKEKKTWKKILQILFVIQILVAVSTVFLAMTDYPMLTDNFGFTYQPNMGILQLVMIYNLFLSAGICLLGFLWIRKGNIAGTQIAILLGFLMFLVSFIVFVKFDRVDMLLIDSIRAFLMFISGILAFKEQKKVQISNQ